MFGITEVLLIIASSISTQVNQEAEATFFVATNGNDDWSGKLPAPNAEGTDGPFATLVRARDAVRQLKAKEGSKQPLTVMVRGSKYYLDEAFVLSAAESGAQDCPIIYTAYPGEKPILSGGRRVTGWKTYKGKILQAELPSELKDSEWKSRQLFFNGKRQIRARWPNFEKEKPLYGGWASMEGPAEEGSHIAFKYKPGTFKHHWAKPQEAEVNVLPFVEWCNNIVPIESVDEENRIITLAREIWRSGTMSSEEDFVRYANMPFHPGNRFAVENVLEELDQPGEWCLDSEEGIVYFWPPEELTDDSEVVIPVLDCLIDLQGASHVTISGFTFTETTSGDNYHRFGLQGYGAMLPIRGWKYCGESMHLKDTKYCTVENNHFDAVGGNAVYLEGYNLKNQIRYNEFSHVGANGVCLLGTIDSHPMFNQVVDNHFHHTGTMLMYTAAVFLGLSDGNLIAHNSIHDVPHHAINLATNGYGRNIVEYNEIRRTCLELHDNGAINSWMDRVDASKSSYVLKDAERAGHILRYNFISDSAQGFYLDDWTSNCFVYGNIIVRSGNGINVHGGKNNVLENNIIVECSNGISYSNGLEGRPSGRLMAGFNTGNRSRNNIIYATAKADKASLFVTHGPTDTERVIGESDYNLFFNAGGKYAISSGPITSLEQWKKMGFDTNSLIADPMFVDPEHDDYRLSPESPAFTLGFQPIDVTKIGLKEKSQ